MGQIQAIYKSLFEERVSTGSASGILAVRECYEI
jgi:hypothetical protein